MLQCSLLHQYVYSCCRLVSAAYSFMGLKAQFLVQHQQPHISVFEWLVKIFVQKKTDSRMLF